MGQSPDGATYSETQADYILIQGNADLKDGWVYPRVWTTQKTKTAEAGDLIMSVRAPAGTMGKTSYNAVIGRGVASIKGNEFIFQTLNKMDADGYWRRLSAGSTFESLNSDSIKNAEIMVPTTQEQVQIGNIFQNLDNLITLHQRKYDKLVNVKKAMLEKMFPEDGADVPEIRFKGFTEAWEQCKFEDITYLSGEKNRDNNIFESYSVTNDKGFVPQVEQFENGGTMATADKSMYYIVSKNSFAYNPARINVGSIGYYDKPEKVIVSSLYEVFKTINNINDRFLWHWFKSNAFQKMIEQYQEGGVRLYFYYDKLCVCSIDIPKYEEQYMIGEILDKIDNLITLHQRKLEKLKNLKKACLEKMFV